MHELFGRAQRPVQNYTAESLGEINSSLAKTMGSGSTPRKIVTGVTVQGNTTTVTINTETIDGAAKSQSDPSFFPGCEELQQVMGIVEAHIHQKNQGAGGFVNTLLGRIVFEPIDQKGKKWEMRNGVIQPASTFLGRLFDGPPVVPTPAEAADYLRGGPGGPARVN